MTATQGEWEQLYDGQDQEEMKRSSRLLWGNFIKKVHPPLLVSTKDVEVLQKSLNASFREQLDARYEGEDVVSKHMRELLGNPLLLHKSHVNAALTTVPLPAHSTQRGPMDIFERSIIDGTATAKIAGLCILAQWHRCTESSDVRTAMKESGAGTAVCQYLWTRHSSISTDFFSNLALVRPLIRFMVAEDKHGMVLAWIKSRRFYEGEASGFQYTLGAGTVRKMAYELVSSELYFKSSLPRAFSHFFAILDIFRISPNSGLSDLYLARLCASLIIVRIAKLPANLREEIPVDVYDYLSSQIPSLFPQHSELIIDLARLHPSHRPTSQEQSDARERVLNTLSKKHNPNATRAFNDEVIGAAQSLLSDGRRKDASQILKNLGDRITNLDHGTSSKRAGYRRASFNMELLSRLTAM